MDRNPWLAKMLRKQNTFNVNEEYLMGGSIFNLNLIGNLIHDYNDFNRIHMKINVDYTLQESQPVQ